MILKRGRQQLRMSESRSFFYGNGRYDDSDEERYQAVMTVTFPEMEQMAGVFTKSMLRLLCHYPSAASIRQVKRSQIACHCT
jgi:hypothetical protein